MSDALDVSVQAEPVTDATAAPVDTPVVGAETQPEVEQEQQQQPAKTFTQDEVNAIVGERLAREERKLRRELQQQIEAQRINQEPQAEAPQQLAKPTPAQFTTTEDYVEALADWKAKQVVSAQIVELQTKAKERARQAYQQQVAATYQERVGEARTKYNDFDAVAFNPQLPITDAMAETIQHSEQGAEVHYYLGKNPAEAKRIAQLSPFLQAKEIGRLEAKLAANPPQSHVSSAPAPISPVTAARGASVHVDLDDPASLKRMGTTAWIEADRKRQEAEWRRAHG